MQPKIVGYFMFFILVTLNIFLRFVCYKKFSTSTSYSRYTRQFTTWNAYITCFLLILCDTIQRNQFTKIFISFLIYGVLTNWFVLTARWYWFKLPNHKLPLSWILSDLWFHLIVPIVYTFFAMYLIQVSGIQQTASEYVLAVCFFFCTLIVWYLLNLGGMMYSPNSYPWPYANGAGSLNGNGNKNGNENGNKNDNGNENNNFDFKHLIKLGFTFLNILLVLLYGWWFWRTVPRNFVNHSVFY
jgi:hypothetical protein